MINLLLLIFGLTDDIATICQVSDVGFQVSAEPLA